MSLKTHLPRLALAALCTLTSLAATAADEPSVTLDRPGAGMRELKKGDNLPDQYQRDSLALKDWKARHLAQPEKDQQWI